MVCGFHYLGILPLKTSINRDFLCLVFSGSHCHLTAKENTYPQDEDARGRYHTISAKSHGFSRDFTVRMRILFPVGRNNILLSSFYIDLGYIV